MRIEKIIKVNQPNIYVKLNKKRKQNKKKSRRGKENLSFCDLTKLMGINRNIYKRRKGGAFIQK